MPRNISNSEVSTWLRCRQQYVWSFIHDLAPNVEAQALTRGTMGHEAFQRYSEARIDGKSHDAALQYSEEVFTKYLAATGNVELILKTKQLYMRYQQFHKGWPDLKILSVEERFDLPLTDDLVLPIRYDTMVEERTSGKRLIGDYKFTYDFWSVDDHRLNAQMPKYIFVMRANGYHIDGGFLEEVRTRPLGKEKASDARNTWRRTNYYPSVIKQKQTIKQHIAASLEIDEFRNLPTAEQEARTIPVLDKYGACKFCDFKEPCASKLDGGDPQVILDTGFRKNTYGYNFEEVKELI